MHTEVSKIHFIFNTFLSRPDKIMTKHGVFLIIYLLLCPHAGLYAQRKDPDSLKNRYQLLRKQPGFQETDTAYINTLYAISYGIGREDLDSARVLAKKTILLSKESAYPKGVVMGTYALSIVRLLEGKQRSAIALAAQVEQGADSLEDKGFLLRALNAKGIAYRSLNQPDSSYLNYYRGLRLAQEIQSKKHQYALNLNIGLLFLNTMNHNEALLHYREAQKQIDPKVNPGFQLTLNLKMAELFLNQKKLDSAQVYLKRTDEALKKGIGYAREKSAYWNFMGDFHFQCGEWKKAKDYYSQTTNTMGNAQEPNVTGAYLGLARSEYQLRNYVSSLTHARKVKEMDKGRNLANTANASYKLLAQLFNSQGEQDSARVYLQIYQRKYDSLRRRINSNSLALLQIRQSEIERDQKQKLEKVLAAREQMFLGVFWLFLGLTVITFAILLLRDYRHYKDQVLTLNRITKEKDQLFTILGHDLRSPLSTLQELLSLYEEPNGDKRFLKDQLTSLRRRVFYSKETLNNMMRWVNDQLADANPVKKEVLVEDLVPRCIDNVFELARKKGISISFSPEPNKSIYIDPIHLEIVLNNLLLNAIKFSNPGNPIELRWSYRDNVGTLSIRDYGIGMKKEQIEQYNQQGSIKHRKGTSGESGLGIGLSICSKLMQLNDAGLELLQQQPGTQANLIFKTN